jgi:hypothetical protein
MKNETKITFVKSPEEGEICAVFVNELGIGPKLN